MNNGRNLTGGSSFSRMMVVILVVLLLGIPLPAMAINGTGSEEGDLASGPDGPSSRMKKFPNTDTWEWMNPIPNHNKLNDVMWQPSGDRLTIVGHSGLISELEGSVWSTIQTNTIYNLWHIEYRANGDYALIVGNHGTVLKYVPGQVTHLETDIITRLQGIGWKSDGSYALISGWEGTLLKYDGSTFSTIETGFDGKLYNVSYSDNGGWLIVGEDGTLLTYDEPTGNVTTITTGIDDLLYNLDWYGDTALIVGQNGTVLKYKSGSVTKVTNSITSNHLWGVEWDDVNGYALISGIDGTAMIYETPGGLSTTDPGTSEWLISISFLNNGNDAWIVGTSGTVYRYTHTVGWSEVSSKPFTGDFKDVQWAPNGSYALIVGTDGTVLRYETSNGLSSLNSGTTVTLRALSFAPNGTALIVGDSGTVLSYNGTNFTKLPSGVVGQNLLAVDFRTDGSYGLIVGSFGKILKYDGASFLPIIPEDQAQFYLFGVSFHPTANYAIVVGASGMAYKCEEDPAPKYQPAGMKCLRVPTGVFTTLRDIEFRDDGAYAMVVGLSGMVLKYDSTGFDEVETDAPAFTLQDVKWKTNSLYPVITGSEGIFLKYSGYGAVQMPCPAIASLNGISWKGTSALVVGDKNQILMYESSPLNNPFASILKPGVGTEFTIMNDIEFSGFQSLAPDDESVQFFWLSNISGTLGSKAKFVSKLPYGHHKITLYVNTTTGKSDSDHVEINVILNAQPPVPVIDSPVDGMTYNSTDDIFFDASSSTDPNDDPLQFYWYSDIQGDLAAGTGFSIRLMVGLHTITLTAYDGVFNISTKVNITVKEPNKPPNVSIVSPKKDDEIHTGEEIRFEATALDPDGDSLTYSWFSNISGFLDDHKLFLGNLSEGKHMLTFSAEDGFDHNISAWVNVTVLPPIHINAPPLLVIDYPDDGEEIKGIINITGTASDTDGVLKIVEYKIGNDNWRATEGNETWSFQWDTLAFDNGEYTFSVRAYDGENHTVLQRNVTISNKWKDVHAYFLYPADGLTLNGDVEVKGRSYHDQATKGKGIQLVQIRVDGGKWNVASGTDPWIWNFKTSNFKNGEHTLEVMATDDDGTFSDIELITIQVENQESSMVIPTSLLMLIIGIIIVIVVVVIIATRSRKSRSRARKDEFADFERELDEEMGVKAKGSKKKKGKIDEEE